MALRDVFARDLQRIIGAEGGLGEPVTYRPRVGDPVSVRAIVDRIGVVQDDQSEIARETVVVLLPLGGEVGVSALPTPGEEIDVPFREGAAATRGRIRSIVSQDAGGVTLEVVR